MNAQSYDSYLQSVKTEMECYKAEYRVAENKDSILAVAGLYLEEQIGDSIFSYWEGTPWDFSGHTNKPQTGVIACGYYVSTTLKHMGLNLNRYRMAQQSALSEVKTLDQDYTYFEGDYHEFLSFAKDSVDEGLYIVGLTSHVGYLLVEKEQSYFIHSNYVEPFGVAKEKIEESEALSFSQDFVLGKISRNKELIKKWLFNEEFEIVYDKSN